MNKQTGQWGTIYDESKDLGRVPMETAKTSAPVETFNISFEGTKGHKTMLHLKWADVDASVEIEAAK